MAKMNLSKALKTKNRIAGELSKLQSIFSRENSRDVKSTSSVDREKLLGEIAQKRKELILIKTLIANANVEINGMLAEMSELKAYATFIQGLTTTNGTISETRGFREIAVEKTMDAFLKQEDVDRIGQEITKSIDELQDRVDAHNATAAIEI